MSLLLNSTGTLASWIQKEIDLGQTVKIGTHGQAVTRIQEWLNLHGFGLAIELVNEGRVLRSNIARARWDLSNDSSFIALRSPFVK